MTTDAPKLRWVFDEVCCWEGFSGELKVGEIAAFSGRANVQSMGNLQLPAWLPSKICRPWATLGEAQRAVETAWSDFLTRAELAPLSRVRELEAKIAEMEKVG